jgi:hypothetical protein
MCVPLGRVADLDSLLRSSEALFGGELVEQPLAPLLAWIVVTLSWFPAEPSASVNAPVTRTSTRRKLELFADRAGNACGGPRTRGVIHSAQNHSGHPSAPSNRKILKQSLARSDGFRHGE